ncbi:hypothetical protein [Chitinolyticbacter meiyuanensis]|uniref:hypothetical protein n=1 Tax=Chitinolyticbacter meiyuanensis TaxID=682798 RepID=UPI0011E59781|nr:hypothetical protein [Chitinolyticbacter meiyuanensis]
MNDEPLPHDETLARQYRALPPEAPPAALDAAILDAAAKAIQPRRTRRQWPGWLVAPQLATVCATLLLGGFVYLLWPKAPLELADPAALEKQAKQDSDYAAPPGITQLPPEKVANRATKPVPERTIKHRAEQPVVATAEPKVAETLPTDVALAYAPAEELRRSAPATAAAPAPMRESSVGSTAPQADATASALIDERFEQGIREIRQLLAVGHVAEAEHAWHMLTARYPSAPLPDDLAQRWPAPQSAASAAASQPADAPSRRLGK